MSIDNKSLDNYSEVEIIAYCLNEMTFSDFEQDEIQEKFKKIKGVKEEYDSLDTEEKAKRNYSLDEVKELLKINDEKSNANDETE